MKENEAKIMASIIFISKRKMNIITHMAEGICSLCALFHYPFLAYSFHGILFIVPIALIRYIFTYFARYSGTECFRIQPTIQMVVRPRIAAHVD